jgi:hypothetical protein
MVKRGSKGVESICITTPRKFSFTIMPSVHSLALGKKRRLAIGSLAWPAVGNQIEVEEPGSARGWCGRQRRTTESEAGGRE